MYSTGNSAQYSVMAYMEKESQKKKKKRVDIHKCVTDSLCCTPETNKDCKSIICQYIFFF